MPNGVALVITLGFLVILTALVLGFFSIVSFRKQVSGSGVRQAQADALARSAAKILVGELRAEMADPDKSVIFGEDGVAVATLSDAEGVLIFRPKTTANVLPEKVGDLDATWQNVVKRSFPSASGSSDPLALYSGGRALVAESATALTSAKSLNGRAVDDDVWHKTELLPADATAGLAPHWCMVTRQGVVSVTDADINELRDGHHDNFVVGRFAYVVYDTGGLIDINVAGNALPATDPIPTPTPSPTTNPNPYSSKGNSIRNYLHQVDLSRIPGVENANALVTWRSPVTGSDTSYLFESSNDFKQTRVGDQRFLGRQDLLAYQKANPAVLTSEALPYLTTFSRTLNAPSWGPTYNVSDKAAIVPSAANEAAVYFADREYKDQQDDPAVANRFIPNVRIDTTTTLTGYHNDGTSYTYEVAAGEPLVQRRFPLGRLDWLGHSGPINGGSAANIKACFGLVWDEDEKWWIYTGSTSAGDVAVSDIDTLEQVAAEKRAPNFMELLQAGILQGSLGIVGYGYGTPLTPSDTAVGVEHSFADPTAQVIQIAANIIDQNDADSFPTRIYFQPRDYQGQTLPGKYFAGSENVPSISKMMFSAYRPADTPTTVKGWFEFELWNPYVGPVNEQPSSYRIRLEPHSGDPSLRMKFDIMVTDGDDSSGAPAYTGGSGPDAGRSLTISGTNLSERLTDPQSLDTLRASGLNISGSRTDDTYSDAHASYTGFYVGDWGPVIGPSDYLKTVRPNVDGGDMRFILEYEDLDGEYVPFQSFTNAAALLFAAFEPSSVHLPPTSFLQLEDRFLPANVRAGVFSSIDPRTLRFGMGIIAPYKWDTSISFAQPLYDKSLAWSESDTTRQYVMTFSIKGPNFTSDASATFNERLTASNGSKYRPNNWNSTRNGHFRLADNRGAGVIDESAQHSSYPNNWFFMDTFYRDLDGVQRYGDPVWNPSDGVFPMASVASRPDDRPVILNRTFQSVGEIGYAFRDLPFKSVDFSSERSADAGLLDLFCINEGNEQTSLQAGVISLNSPCAEVFDAILSGVTRTELDPGDNLFTANESTAVAEALVKLTSGSGPGNGALLNKSELATRFGADAIFQSDPDLKDVLIKGRKESVVRTLAGIGETRTWNLLIDVIAQSGRFPLTAADLSEFTVEGEQRYWLHVAIDRYTGEVIDQQWEAVKN